ncbi:MAG TPA: GGDEF domain-containing protein [Candidatus Aminicenantes bacterium]|nr:GGDEF domain-containing protein [Candidatus Aminicenantes bacterium]
MNDERTILDTKKLRRKSKGRGRGRNRLLLTVIDGSELDFGKTFSFSQNDLVIGRDPECHVPLHDERVSRNHCRMTVVGDEGIEQITICDLGSTNGTLVNGEPMKQRAILPGDRIEVGSTVLRVGTSDDLEQRYQARLFNMATLDPLTGVFTKRYIHNALDNQVRVARRNHRQFCILLLDIDDFKRINDRFGHLIGDEWLKMVGFTVNRLLREQDMVGRIGGEEFLVILPETPLKGAVTLADRIRQQIAELELTTPLGLVTATISIGVALFPDHGEEGRLLTARADEAMYQAKGAGKNRVFGADG